MKARGAGALGGGAPGAGGRRGGPPGKKRPAAAGARKAKQPPAQEKQRSQEFKRSKGSTWKQRWRRDGTAAFLRLFTGWTPVAWREVRG